MYVRASNGSGGGGGGNVERLIYIDDVGSNNVYWFQDYDDEVLTITAGALRTTASSNGDVTFTASKGGVLHIRQGNAYSQGGSVSLTVNGTSVAGNVAQVDTTVNISVGDTIRWTCSSYYKSIILTLSDVT